MITTGGGKFCAELNSSVTHLVVDVRFEGARFFSLVLTMRV